MKTLRLATGITAVLLLCSMAHAAFLTFDDVPSGTFLRYSPYMMDTYRVWYDDFFQAVDHTTSLWGPPHSGNNVLAWAGSEGYDQAVMGFGHLGMFDVYADEVRSVGAFFSTQPGVMVRMTAYHLEPVPGSDPVAVDSVVIGAAGGWNNKYVEIGSPELPFEILGFQGVNSQDELLGFCLDDMTVTLVPEPSSLVALGSALASVCTVVVRRRWRA